MNKSRRYLELIAISVFLFTLALTACVQPQVAPKKVVQNAAEHLAKPYVLLISIDGYRYDYNRIFKPKNLLEFEKNSARLEALLPIYPSKTFPNHYSIATGLYADQHEIVANIFIDPVTNKGFRRGDTTSVFESQWYKGNPLWVLAEKSGMLSACYFWVGSDVEIAGVRPSYYKIYDKNVTNEDRVKQIVEWLKLPEAERPHLLTLYFSDVDTAGHRFGTKSKEIKEAVASIDNNIGNLFKEINALNLPLNIIILSDHGMEDFDPKKIEYPEDYADLSAFEVIGVGPQMQLYLKPGHDKSKIEDTQRILRRQAKNFKVYTREDIPTRYHYSKTPKVSDLILDAKIPYSLQLRAEKKGYVAGNHGYDPIEKNMWGIFYAKGPAFVPNKKLKPVENINVYPLIAEILGLQVSTPIDGKIEAMKPLLKAVGN